MKKVKVLEFVFKFFALCAVIAFACTLVELWAGVAAVAFGGLALVTYLLYDFYAKFNQYSVQ